MEIFKNKIYRRTQGNTVHFTRVDEILKDGRVSLVNGEIVNADQLEPVINEGEVIMVYDNTYTAENTIEYIDEDSTFDGYMLIDSNCNPTFAVRQFAPKKVEPAVIELTGVEKEISDYLTSVQYKHDKRVVKTIAAEWNSNKKALKSLLSAHPNWNEENQNIELDITMPHFENENSAQDAYYYIIRKYSNTYSKEVLDVFDFPDFFDISAKKSQKFNDWGIKIQSGVKPSRAMRKFFTALKFDENADFERDYAILADHLSHKEIKCKITFSIHPLDYLRMSEGNSWTSCHRVSLSHGDRGCYHNGAQSYLMDSQAIIVSILEPEYEGKPYMQPKINRMMIFVNEDGDILQSRCYPQKRNPELEAFLGGVATATISDCKKMENVYRTVVQDYKCGDYVISKGVHYRDYECRDFGQRIWSFNKDSGRFYIGHESYCLICGRESNNSGSMICDSCTSTTENRINNEYYLYYICPNTKQKITRLDPDYRNPENGKYYSKVYTCSACGQIYYEAGKYCPECRDSTDMECDCCGKESERLLECGDKWFCPDCAENKTVICEECGCSVLKEDSRYIEDDSCYVCESCFEDSDYFCCEDCGYNYHYGTYIENHGDVCEDCLNDNYFYCDECGRYYDNDEAVRPEDSSYFYCSSCAERLYHCSCCGGIYESEDSMRYIEEEDTYVCEECYNDGDYYHCYYCDCNYRGEYITTHDDDKICPDCYERYYETCDDCEEVFEWDVLEEHDGKLLCSCCLSEKLDEELQESEEPFEPYSVVLKSRYKGIRASSVGVVRAVNEKIVVEFADRYCCFDVDTDLLIPLSKLKPGVKFVNYTTRYIIREVCVEDDRFYYKTADDGIWCCLSSSMEFIFEEENDNDENRTSD